MHAQLQAVSHPIYLDSPEQTLPSCSPVSGSGAHPTHLLGGGMQLWDDVVFEDIHELFVDVVTKLPALVCRHYGRQAHDVEKLEVSESSWYMRNWRNTKVARNYYRNQQTTGTCTNLLDETTLTASLVGTVPPYSLDLNPIEKVFSKIKAFLKENESAYQATSEPRILVAHAFASVSSEDCIKYIRHACYVD